jgi:serine/threonine protein kinase
MSMKLDDGDVLRNGQYKVQQHMRSVRDKEVYLAYDTIFDCQVTLDVFSNKATMPSGLRVSVWEARVLHKLGDHRNIARVQGYWEEGGAAIMATRYLPGGRLEDLIVASQQSDEALAVQRVLQLSVELADGLAHIHQCRLLYLDLQPHNVLFDEWGTPRLVDFDTAVSVNDPHMVNVSNRSVINYMAPELIHGQGADERADLYSLGATIYEMCEGHPPFIGAREQIMAASRADPPSLQREDLPAGLQDLVLGLLALDPDQRPNSAAEVKSHLVSLRTARENLERLLTSNVGTNLKAPLEAYLKADSGALTQSPSAITVPEDHRYLMRAIIALAETDYRRAVIDAATATEVALRSAITDHLRQRGWSSRDIDQTIWDARGLDELYARYTSFVSSRKVQVSASAVRLDLAKVRNKATHEGRIPFTKKAIQAVEIAYALVNAAHPLKS